MDRVEPEATGRSLHVRVVKLGGIDQFDAEGEESVVARMYREWLEDCTREAREAREDVAARMAAPGAAMLPTAPTRPVLAFMRPESGGGDV